MKAKKKMRWRPQFIFVVAIVLLINGAGAWGQESLPRAGVVQPKGLPADHERANQEFLDKPVLEKEEISPSPKPVLPNLAPPDKKIKPGSREKQKAAATEEPKANVSYSLPQSNQAVLTGFSPQRMPGSFTMSDPRGQVTPITGMQLPKPLQEMSFWEKYNLLSDEPSAKGKKKKEKLKEGEDKNKEADKDKEWDRNKDLDNNKEKVTKKKYW